MHARGTWYVKNVKCICCKIIHFSSSSLFAESSEKVFKKHLDERQEYVEKLLKQMQEKEREFQEYCHQVEVDRMSLIY